MSSLPDPASLNLDRASPTNLTGAPDTTAIGRGESQFGADVSQAAYQLKAHFDTINAQNAVNQLDTKRIALTLGPPSTPGGSDGGIYNAMGANAVGQNGVPPLLDTASKAMDDAVEAGGANLSGNALRMYHQSAQGISRQFKADVLTHVMRQSKVYQTDVMTQTVGQLTQQASQYSDNVPKVLDAVRSIGDAYTPVHLANGGSAAPADIAQAAKPMQSKAISLAIENRLVNQDPTGAATLLNAFKKDYMTPEDVDKAQQLVVHGVSQQSAFTSVDQAVHNLNPTGSTTKILSAQDIETAALKIAGPNIDPQARSLIQQQAAHQSALIMQNQGVLKENAIQPAQQWLAQNNGNFAALPANLYSAVLTHAPDQLDNLKSYAASFVPGANQATNPVAYSAAVANPGELAKMPESAYQQFKATNFSRADGDKIDALRHGTQQGALALDTSVFNSEVNNRLGSIGIQTAPAKLSGDMKATTAVDQVRHYLAQGIMQRQAELGRKMAPKEITDYVDHQFATSTQIPSMLWGSDTKPLLSVQRVGDIPSDALTKVDAALAKKGIANPTDEQRLNVYWKANSK